MEKESETLLRARRKRVVSDLLKGREMATRLQTLLQRNPAGDLSGSSSVHSKLSLEILGSFSNAISQLNGCCVVPPPPPGQRGRILSNDSDGQKLWSDESFARGQVQENETLPPGRMGSRGRGGYKRRKNSGEETQRNVCKTMEDGYAWRKYGQKQIHNSLHPRCYYRCTQRGREGCKATKQVQRVSHDEFQTTYFGHHTCTHSHNPFNNNQQERGDMDDSSSCFCCYDGHHYNQNAVETEEEEEESPLAATEAASQHLYQETSSVVENDVDYERCFENLGNLFRSEEMPLAFLDNKE